MATADARALSRERVSAIAHEILAAFESGELPKALAQLFIHRKVVVPSRAWTWTNRLIAIRRGHVYAAGFRQWQEAGRYVKKGEHAFHILAPRITKAKEDDEGRGVKEGDLVTLGFLAVPVFGYLQTEGEPLAGVEDAPEFVDRLPLIEVARAWGLSVSLYSIEDAPDRLGYFTPGRGIALGTENVSTWAHELIHAADHRLGNLVARSMPRWSPSLAGRFSSNASAIRLRAIAAGLTNTSRGTARKRSAISSGPAPNSSTEPAGASRCSLRRLRPSECRIPRRNSTRLPRSPHYLPYVPHNSPLHLIP
jgi:antirestriction factor ArdC-like protein